MYKTRFSRWGFKKNNSSHEVRQMVSTKLRRETQGKQSEFIRNGKQTLLVAARRPPPDPELLLEQPGSLHLQNKLLQHLRKVFFDLTWSPNTTEGSLVGEWQSVARGPGFQMNQKVSLGAGYLNSGNRELGLVYVQQACAEMNDFFSQMLPFHLFQLLFSYQQPADPGTAVMFWRCIDASVRNNAATHPRFRRLFEFLYDAIQKNGVAEFSNLLLLCRGVAAELLAKARGARHPQAIGAWMTLLEKTDHVDSDQLNSFISILPAAFPAVDKYFGYGSPVSAQMRKWYFTFKTKAGKIAEDDTLDQINVYFHQDPNIPLNYAQRVKRDKAFELSRFHLARCENQPAKYNPRHIEGRYYLQQHCDILQDMYGPTDPQLLGLLEKLQGLYFDAGELDYAQLLQEKREAGIAKTILARNML
ncbi:hypothetical protein NM208_g924 [Fusarium decemcellulare]|uniref:Uncharacterized protein n=1 Tax=Fusarium decemcellulare TaxID=57161 RepID=A0ACC1SXX2_9HYPO|nr:hypothetical protein NM208_g924 [Fusarium decemcellulare]